MTGSLRSPRPSPRAEVEATWGIYQQMITAYREPDRSRGRVLMNQLIDHCARACRNR